MGSFHIGGAEKQLIHLLNYLDKDKYEIILFVRTQEGPNKKDLPKRIKVFDLDTWSKINKRSLLRKTLDEFKTIYLLCSLLKKCAPDFVYGNAILSNYQLLLSIILIGKRSKIKTVFSVVNNPKKYGFWSKFILMYLYNRADRIFACSSGLKDYLCKSTRIKRENIGIMFNCMDLKNIDLNYNKRDFLEGFSPVLPNIICVARMIPQKGYFDLLKAFKIINSKMKSILLV
jgi:glycosyltransferase involved in cell wall biosynthesis